MLTAHLFVSLKEKIWANEFIELNSLLRKGPGEIQKQRIQFKKGEVILSFSDELPKLVEGIEPWSDAFITFMSIYI
jgi:hypothetical protein